MRITRWVSYVNYNYKIEHDCDLFNKYMSFFSLDQDGIYIRNPDRDGTGDNPYRVKITNCPFCGEQFPSEVEDI